MVDTLSIDCEDHQIVVITPQKLSDKVNSQFLNLLLENKKYKFQAATIVNQALMALYSYNSTVGVIVNLGNFFITSIKTSLRHIITQYHFK